MAQSFQFELVSPERLLLSEPVTAVNIPGTDGFFTVLANHAPLMTTLKPGIVVVTMENGEERRIFVHGGFADVNAQGLTLLAERATAVEDLNAATLDRDVQSAEEAVASAQTPEAKARAQMSLEQLREARSTTGV